MDLSPLPNLTLKKYCCKCVDRMDFIRFDAMAVDGRNFVLYDQNRFVRDTALDAWKRRCAVICRCSVGILIDTMFADVPFVRFRQELFWSRCLQDAIGANMEVCNGDPEVQCWLFEKPYNTTYLLHGGAHKTRALKLETCHRTAVGNPIFVGWLNLEMFAVRLKDRHLH